jgi:hypothetical protein
MKNVNTAPQVKTPSMNFIEKQRREDSNMNLTNQSQQFPQSAGGNSKTAGLIVSRQGPPSESNLMASNSQL